MFRTNPFKAGPGSTRDEVEFVGEKEAATELTISDDDWELEEAKEDKMDELEVVGLGLASVEAL